MAKGQVLSDMIKIFIKDSQRYNRIKLSKPESVYFGIVSLIYTILSVVVGGGLFYLAVMLFDVINNSNGVLFSLAMVIAAVVLVLSGLVFYFLFIIRGNIASIYQLRMSKKTIGVIALLFNLLLLIGSILFMLKLLKII